MSSRSVSLRAGWVVGLGSHVAEHDVAVGDDGADGAEGGDDENNGDGGDDG